MASVGEERGPLASEDEVDSEEEAELEEEHRQAKEVSRGKKKRKAKRKVSGTSTPPRPFLAASSQIGPRWTGTVDSPARSWRAAPWRVPDPKAATCGLTRTLFCPSHSFPKTKRKTKKTKRRRRRVLSLSRRKPWRTLTRMRTRTARARARSAASSSTTWPP